MSTKRGNESPAKVSTQTPPRRSFWIVLGIAAVTYFLISLVLTFPLILDLSGSIVGTAGDPFGALYSLWLSVREPIVAAFPHAPVLVWTGQLFTWLFGEVAAYNVMLLSGYVATGAAGFALSYRLTRSVSASFIVGLIFVLAPYHVAQSLQHLGLANLHWLLLFLLALLWFDEKPTTGRAVVFAASFALTMLDSYLYGVFALLIVGLFGTWRLGRWLAHSSRRVWHLKEWGALVFALVLGFALVIPALSPVFQSFSNTYDHRVDLARSSSSLTELAAFSARGFAYVIPPPNNILVGDVTRPFYQKAEEEGTNVTELSIYLGLSVLILAGVGLIGLKRKPEYLHPDAARWASFWLLLAFVGTYFSFAPTMNLFGLEISTPGAVLYQMVPLLRVYSRFGILVLIPVALLAGFGVAWLAARIQSSGRRWSMVGAIGVVLAADLLALPKNRVTPVSADDAPLVYQWLASDEANHVGTIVEYPLVPPEEPDGYTYQLWARIQPHHAINLDYATLGDSEERAQLADLNREDTLERLRFKGVTHVLIHTDKYTPAGAKKYPLEYHGGAPIYLSPSEPGVFIEGTFGTTNVYRIEGEGPNRATTTSDPCTAKPLPTGIGRDEYPVSAQYGALTFLGQLFTAADCGTERVAQLDEVTQGRYTVGSRVTLVKPASAELHQLLETIGFACTEGTAANCTEWSLDVPVPVNDLLPLAPYATELAIDDCTLCG